MNSNSFRIRLNVLFLKHTMNVKKNRSIQLNKPARNLFNQVSFSNRVLLVGKRAVLYLAAGCFLNYRECSLSGQFIVS